jgi:hypothetical protein
VNTRSVLRWITGRLPFPRVIYDRAGLSEYLSRWYLYGVPTASDGKPVFNEIGRKRPGIEVTERDGPLATYLHRFHRGDDDYELHSHPWKISVALILAGGYIEERRVARSVRCRGCGALRMRRVRGVDVAAFERGHAGHGGVTVKYRVAKRVVRPWSFNVIRGNDYHRVELLEEDSWSLFFAGPKIDEWFFWNRESGETTQWEKFIARKRGQATSDVEVS